MRYAVILVALVSGCTHVHPIDVSAERVDEVPQNVHDLDHECERCGDVATENVSEVADEYNWRCNACKPRDVRPKLNNWPRRTFRPRRLETMIVKGN